MTLRYSRSPGRGEGGPRWAWFDTGLGRELDVLEVASNLCREERWTACWVDGERREFVATFGRGGWLNERDRALREGRRADEAAPAPSGQSTSLRAVQRMVQADGGRLAWLQGPDGERPDVVRVAFASAGIVTEAPHFWLRDEILDAREASGALLCGEASVSGWTFQSGSVRHLEAVRKATGVGRYWETSDEDFDRAAAAAGRANLAILRQFGQAFPVSRADWLLAERDPGVEVRVRRNLGPWLPVDGRGRPCP